MERIDFGYLERFGRFNIKHLSSMLKYYCKLIKLSPDEIINEAIAEEEKGIRLIDRRINIHFLKFKKQLIKDGKAKGSVSLHMYAIRSFYDSLDIQIPKYKNPKGDISLEQNYGKLITKEELIFHL